MAKIDIDSLDDEQLEDYIKVAHKSKTAVSDHVSAGGAPRELSLIMIVTGMIAVFASLNLVLAEIQINKDPSADLLCDVNQLVGCSNFLNARFNTIFFGVPNALYGLMFFSAVTTLGVVLVTGARISVLVWRLLVLGMLAASAWLLWFQYTAIFVEGLLCPYCLVTWMVAIVLVIHVLVRSMEAGRLPGLQKVGRALVPWRWSLVLLTYVLLAAVITVNLWDKISTLI